MMPIQASAPGKLVLLGEYAVMEGAPALALAVDRRARVRLWPRRDGRILVRAPQIEAGQVAASIDADGRWQWECGADLAQRLHLITHVWNGVMAGLETEWRRTGFDLEIDTGGFVLEAGRGSGKLGLGSSAALSVALASAWLRIAGCEDLLGDRRACLARLLALHGQWQGGRGSGVDVAASLEGGLIVYRREPGAGPMLERRSWPEAGLHVLFVWSGQAVSTSRSLQHLEAWRESRPDRHALRMTRLGTLAQTGIAALDNQDGSFIEVVAEYARELDNLAMDSGLDIISPSQRRLMDWAVRQGAAFKPCGAGGDIGMLVADTAARLEMLRCSILSDGFQPLVLSADPEGLQFGPAWEQA